MGVTLSSPMTEKNTMFVENAAYRVGVSSMQGWRVSMEDAHAVHLEMPGDQSAAFFAVYDGHGGPSVAEFAGAHLDRFITSQESYKNGNIVAAIERAFMDVDSKMREDKSIVEEMSGSTANVVLIKNRFIYCGNAGDSRAIAFVAGETIPLSTDHKPNNPQEFRRINDAGGWVDANRVNGNLAVSRALGDFPFKAAPHKPQDEQQVTAFPDVRKDALTDQWQFIVLACDGIWDVMSSNEVGDFVKTRLSAGERPDSICEELMTHCLAPDVSGSQAGCDNMTVIIVELLKPRKPSNAGESQDAKRYNMASTDV
ncbi:unnamed protein product [Nesidiocoris tenuis]|uniref:Phosphatase 2C n=2 Tax=Nesidiocoris tenuis TaxID=355587 RepID=A0ABN7AV77_9HEMI|nr:phosphatase 2C [Nesidiocoris tenuis]CAB0018172.1 unnamed protein product [Nesidiocoris tenuis]